jgi:hypothetical protein
MHPSTGENHLAHRIKKLVIKYFQCKSVLYSEHLLIPHEINPMLTPIILEKILVPEKAVSVTAIDP